MLKGSSVALKARLRRRKKKKAGGAKKGGGGGAKGQRVVAAAPPPPGHDSAHEASDYNDDDDEGREGYRVGGYHPVKVGEVYNRRYRVLSKLGWGHFSTVWLCRDEKDGKRGLGTGRRGRGGGAARGAGEAVEEAGRLVALKVQKSASHYTEAAMDEIELLQTVAREAERASGLGAVGPGGGLEVPCVRLVDHFTHRGPHGTHVCMAFEPLGSNLLSLVKAFNYRGIPLSLVRRLTQQIAAGLDFLHRRCGIIHTDLKPENVLLRTPLPPRPKRKSGSGSGSGGKRKKGGGGEGAGGGEGGGGEGEGEEWVGGYGKAPHHSESLSPGGKATTASTDPTWFPQDKAEEAAALDRALAGIQGEARRRMRKRLRRKWAQRRKKAEKKKGKSAVSSTGVAGGERLPSTLPPALPTPLPPKPTTTTTTTTTSSSSSSSSSSSGRGEESEEGKRGSPEEGRGGGGGGGGGGADGGAVEVWGGSVSIASKVFATAKPDEEVEEEEENVGGGGEGESGVRWHRAPGPMLGEKIASVVVGFPPSRDFGVEDGVVWTLDDVEGVGVRWERLSSARMGSIEEAFVSLVDGEDEQVARLLHLIAPHLNQSKPSSPTPSSPSPSSTSKSTAPVPLYRLNIHALPPKSPKPPSTSTSTSHPPPPLPSSQPHTTLIRAGLRIANRAIPNLMFLPLPITNPSSSDSPSYTLFGMVVPAAIVVDAYVGARARLAEAAASGGASFPASIAKWRTTSPPPPPPTPPTSSSPPPLPPLTTLTSRIQLCFQQAKSDKVETGREEKEVAEDVSVVAKGKGEKSGEKGVEKGKEKEEEGKMKGVEREKKELSYEERVKEWEAGLMGMSCVVVDLGNACWVDKHFTDDIQTRQYRAPEVVLQAGYGPSADMWSLGCMAFELLCGDLLFDPKSVSDDAGGGGWSRDEDHLAQMIELVGPMPRSLAMRGRRSRDFFDSRGRLRNIDELRFWGPASVLAEKYGLSVPEARFAESFLLPLLELHPGRRMTAAEASAHPWVSTQLSAREIAAMDPATWGYLVEGVKDDGTHEAGSADRGPQVAGADLATYDDEAEATAEALRETSQTPTTPTTSTHSHQQHSHSQPSTSPHDPIADARSLPVGDDDMGVDLYGEDDDDDGDDDDDDDDREEDEFGMRRDEGDGEEDDDLALRHEWNAVVTEIMMGESNSLSRVAARLARVVAEGALSPDTAMAILERRRELAGEEEGRAGEEGEGGGEEEEEEEEEVVLRRRGVVEGKEDASVSGKSSRMEEDDRHYGTTTPVRSSAHHSVATGVPPPVSPLTSASHHAHLSHSQSSASLPHPTQATPPPLPPPPSPATQRHLPLPSATSSLPSSPPRSSQPSSPPLRPPPSLPRGSTTPHSATRFETHASDEAARSGNADALLESLRRRLDEAERAATEAARRSEEYEEFGDESSFHHHPTSPPAYPGSPPPYSSLPPSTATTHTPGHVHPPSSSTPSHTHLLHALLHEDNDDDMEEEGSGSSHPYMPRYSEFEDPFSSSRHSSQHHPSHHHHHHHHHHDSEFDLSTPEPPADRRRLDDEHYRDADLDVETLAAGLEALLVRVGGAGQARSWFEDAVQREEERDGEEGGRE